MSDVGDEEMDASNGSMNGSIRLAIIAECAITRCALRDLCTAMPNMCIVAQLSSVQNAVTEMQVLQPTLALLGTAITDENCLALQRTCGSLAQPPSLVALRIRPSRQTILDLMGGGLLGILDEQAGEQELTVALTVVSRGDLYLGVHVRAVLSSQASDERPTPPAALTPRERDVLALVVDGETNDGVARNLHMSVKTVETHLSHIYGKLGVCSRTQAVVRAQELGLLATPSPTARPRTPRPPGFPWCAPQCNPGCEDGRPALHCVQ